MTLFMDGTIHLPVPVALGVPSRNRNHLTVLASRLKWDPFRYNT